MNCVDPPALTERQLQDYVDGEADPRTSEHVAKCAYCREQAKNLGQALYRLTAELYRSDCPSSHDLGEYQMKLLSATQTAIIDQHLQQCPHCTNELTQLQTYLHDLTPEIEYTLVEQVKVKVATLISGLSSSSAPQFSPTFAIRGDDNTSFLYEVDDAQIAIEVQDDDENPDLKTIYGIITGLDIAPLTVQLWQSDQKITTTNVDDLFTFQLSTLNSGMYDLVLVGDDVELHVQGLMI